MRNYQIYQVPFESDIRRDVMFYGEDSKFFTPTDAKNAYTGGEYKYVGDIDAKNLNDAFHIGNTGGMPKGAYSLSVGDILVNSETGRIFIVAPCGFDELFAERAIA